MTDRIRAQFLNIVCNASAIEAIESCFRKAGLPIVRHTMAADRLANVMTDEKERSTGCAFVEMGSETTTVAVYRGKLLRHFAVLPLGGQNITRASSIAKRAKPKSSSAPTAIRSRHAWKTTAK